MFMTRGDRVIEAIYSAPGDFDGDGDVDLTDFAVFMPGLTGPSATYPESGDATLEFDFDSDGNVDLADFADFQTRFGGEG